MTHYMNLWDDSFCAIKEGWKTIEMRLNDEKRSIINVGDCIEFTNTTTQEKMSCIVVNIHGYPNFAELYKNHCKISIGYKEEEKANPDDMLKYYTTEQIEKYGVVGIELARKKSMIFQYVDGIKYKMGAKFDFSFLKKYGTVFKVFDDQDSGNICFGINGDKGKIFVKFAGAPTAEYEGNTYDAIKRLKGTLPVYRDIKHDSLIKLITAEEIDNGFALVYEWADGKCMGRMYEDDHRFIMALPVKEKLSIFDTVISFLQSVHNSGYVAVDFYDGSIMYDEDTHKTTICDIDFFHKKPYVNDMGRMWGSARFMSPEEYELGAPIDEITNVFTLGQMGFSLFTDSNRDVEVWPLSMERYKVLEKATDPDREKRYSSIMEFKKAWGKKAWDTAKIE